MERYIITGCRYIGGFYDAMTLSLDESISLGREDNFHITRNDLVGQPWRYIWRHEVENNCIAVVYYEQERDRQVLGLHRGQSNGNRESVKGYDDRSSG